jgi:hypothetical protein
MRLRVFTIITLFLFIGCSIDNSNKKFTKTPEIPKVSKGSFGKPFKETNIINAPLLTKIFGTTNSMNVKVKGFIIESCEQSGCWMDIYLGRKKTMHVTFKDNKFAIPLDSQNKTAIFEGKVFTRIIHSLYFFIVNNPDD